MTTAIPFGLMGHLKSLKAHFKKGTLPFGAQPDLSNPCQALLLFPNEVTNKGDFIIDQPGIK